jgi:Ca2+/H+ antiporter
MKGQPSIVQSFLVGSVAINHLLLLGICFIHGGHHDRESTYPMLIAPISARMLPAGFALLLSSVMSTTGFEGGYPL